MAGLEGSTGGPFLTSLLLLLLLLLERGAQFMSPIRRSGVEGRVQLDCKLN